MRRRKHSHLIEALEQRVQLSASYFYSPLADFSHDLQANTDTNGSNNVAAWQYLWNAPTGWIAGGATGDMATGAVTDPTSYKLMAPVSGATQVTADGNANPTDHIPDLAISLATTDGATTTGSPGAAAGSPAAVGNTLDRYAIAAYTVSATGYYAIVDSRLSIASNSNSGVEVIISVGSGSAIHQVLEDVAVPNQTIDYDTDAFFAKSGQTVYVAFGAYGNESNDVFTTDFTVAKYNPETLTTIAGYQSDYHAASPLTQGWQYLWNAPTGWTNAPGVTGDLATGALGNTANYMALVPVTNNTMWTADGNTQTNDHQPDGYIRLLSTGGRPGNVGTGTNPDRYAIAAYTVQQSGRYAIMNSTINTTITPTDGVEVVVNVNSRPAAYTTVTPTNGSVTNFDTDLGYLAKGDTIYAAFGSNANISNDGFNMDFKVVQFAARPAPLTSLGTINPAAIFSVTNYGATVNNDADDDSAGIIATFNAAKSYQTANGVNVEVSFPAGTYHVLPKGTSAANYTPHTIGTYALNVSALKNMLVEAAGATVIVRNPSVGLFNLTGTSSNVIIHGLTVDYGYDAATPNLRLPFTQGVVQSVNSGNNTAVISIDSGFSPLSDPMFTKATGYTPTFDSFIFDPNHLGRQLSGTSLHYTYNSVPTVNNGDGTFTVTFGNVTALAAGQHIALDARDSHLFNVAQTTQLTFSGVTAYASPQMGFVGDYNDQLNVIGSNIVIKPGSGRLMSTNADGIHLPDSRGGVWIENSVLQGQCDDAVNSLPYAFAVTANPSSRNFTVMQVSSDGGSRYNSSTKQFAVGDHVTFFDMVNGVVLGRAKVTAVTFSTNVTITIDQDIAGVTYSTTGDPKLYTLAYDTDMGSNYVVRDSTFEDNHGHSLLTRGNSGVILGNTFTGCAYQAIRVGDLPFYGEGLEARHITIFGNSFTDIVQDRSYLAPASSQIGWTAAISFYISKRDPLGRSGTTGERPADTAADGISAFSDLTITNNTFNNWRPAAIIIRNARRVTISGNTIGAWLAGSTETYTPIKFYSVQGATVAANINNSGLSPLLTSDALSTRILLL